MPALSRIGDDLGRMARSGRFQRSSRGLTLRLCSLEFFARRGSDDAGAQSHDDVCVGLLGSRQPAFGIPAGIVALTALILLFSPAALRWAAGGDQDGPASSAKRGPDSR